MNWLKVINGVWKTSIGEVEDFHPMSVIKPLCRENKLRELGDADFPKVLSEINVDNTEKRLVVGLPIDSEERFYGMGLQFMKVNHRGRTRYLHTNSDPLQDTGESHAPVPFVISDKGYGLFFNTSRAVTIYCGSSVRSGSRNHPSARDQVTDPDFQYTPLSDLMEVVIPARGIEIYAFGGASIREIVQRYNLYFGGGVLPPKWGLGFWHRVPSKYTASEVMAEALEYREKGFPCDVIGLEPGWHSRSYPCSYEWSGERFPEPASFVKEMNDEGFQINLWEHGYVSPDAGIYDKLKPYGGSHSVWAGLAPDYSIPEASEILKEQHKREHIDIGVSGYKLDECDGSELTSFSWMFPPHASFPSGHDGEQMRQMYGLLLQKMTSEIFKEANRRTYGLVRASSGAASSLPYVLYSDLYDHRQFIRGLVNSSFSGLLCTPEVRSAKSAEEWARRFQTVCFSPLAMINAWCDGTKPWSFPEAEATVREYIKLRMQLIPYFYSAFARYYFEGIPPFRAMHLEEGYDARKVGVLYKEAAGFVKKMPWDVFDDELDSQYMAGDSILVAPLTAGQKERLVYLPEGKWYDFYTGEELEGRRFITVEADIDKLPLYVKDGGIIPMMPTLDHVPAGQPVPLEVRFYGSKPGSFMLYDDDGSTYDYEKGVCGWIELTVSENDQGHLEGSIHRSDGYSKWSYSEINWVFMVKQ